MRTSCWQSQLCFYMCCSYSEEAQLLFQDGQRLFEAATNPRVSAVAGDLGLECILNAAVVKTYEIVKCQIDMR